MDHRDAAYRDKINNANFALARLRMERVWIKNLINYGSSDKTVNYCLYFEQTFTTCITLSMPRLSKQKLKVINDKG